jgi:hypothetical protein
MKKRSKKYRQHRVDIPMMVETRDDLALTLRMSIEALIAAPGVETYNAVSLQLVTLGRVVGKQDFMEQAMLDVFERFERVGKIGASAAEAAVLRKTANDMDAALALVPVNKFAAAEAKTRVWCEENGVGQ